MLHEIAAQTINDTHASLWPKFAPELILCATIMAMLLVRLCRWGQYIPPFVMAIVGSGLALVYAAPWLALSGQATVERQELFTGMLVYDNFTVFIRGFLLIFAILFAIFTRISRMPDREDASDFYCLVLGATLGMCLMASANHLLMVFMAVEMASVPSYALAGQLKARRQASEAALKYSIYGAGAAGIMLYGISLIAGVLHSVHLPTLAAQLAEQLPLMSAEEKAVLALGGVMIMVGLSFKLSAVPFHFWCPDVFEGATAEVDAFLSVASKAAALALLVRVCVGFGTLQPTIAGSTARDVPVVSTATALVSADDNGEGETGDTEAEDEGEAAETGLTSADIYGTDPLAPVRHFITVLVGVVAAVTCTFGNLAAYGQTNIKRLMGYSTIAHAGYMMMAVPAAMTVANSDPDVAQKAIGGLLLYAAIYLLMNVGAFAIIAFYRNLHGSEEIVDYSGLVRRSPVMVVMFAAILFSLVGLPPLAGFLGKFAIFASLAQAWQATGSKFLLGLLVVGGLNTAISLFYYLRVVKVMAIDPERDSAPVGSAPSIPWLAASFVAVLVIPIATMLVYLNAVNEWTLAAARQLF